MSEIETSAAVVERICLDLNAFDPLDETIRATLRALTARLALAEGMAEALQKIIDADWWEPTCKAGDEPDEVDGRCAEIARTALAAWRAAAVEPPASP